MSDEKQVPIEDELSLDNILKEISTWSEKPSSAQQEDEQEPFVSETIASPSPYETAEPPFPSETTEPLSHETAEPPFPSETTEPLSHETAEPPFPSETTEPLSHETAEPPFPSETIESPSHEIAEPPFPSETTEPSFPETPEYPSSETTEPPPALQPNKEETSSALKQEATNVVPLIAHTAVQQEGEEPSERGNSEAEEASPENPIPDNLIPFAPPGATSAPENPLPPPPPQPEPETLLEAAQIGARMARAWVKNHKESFKKPELKVPKVKLFKPHIKLPALPKLPMPPDTPVKELSALYAKQLPGLRIKSLGAFMCAVFLLLLAAVAAFPSFPLPAPLKNPDLLTNISLGLFILCLIFSYPILLQGFAAFLMFRPGMHTLASLGAMLVLVDAILLMFSHSRPYSLPLFAPSALVLAFQLWGRYNKTLALRLTCRTASSAAAPDLLTLEPSQWNGKGVYRRRFGSIAGFGSQVQAEDGAELRFRHLALLLLPSALLVSVVPALISKQPQLIPWALSATFTAAATLSGALCFSLPFCDLARRLSKIGVALAGWTGVCEARAGCGLLVESTDLFPPGSVKLTSFRAFENHNPTYVISVTASLIRAAGGGLDSVFYALLRTEGGSFVTATELEVESEGISAHVAGEPVLVGNLNFLARKGVDIPLGVRVQTGVFCSIGGSFAGQFVLDYSLHKHAAVAMDSLLSSRVTPVLIGLDFNLVPSILRKLFHFPWDKMAFPDFTQRAKLRHAPPPRESTLLALLCLQGLSPVSSAAAGAQRLQAAVRVCTGFASFAAIFGVMLTGYLASLAAFTALSPMGLSLFLISWFIPTAMVSGWVNQF